MITSAKSAVSAPPPIRQEPLLSGTSGIGFHYFPDTEHYSAHDLDVWLPEMQALGVRWLTVPADPSIIFEVDVEQRWTQAAASLGVDITTLSAGAGHA